MSEWTQKIKKCAKKISSALSDLEADSIIIQHYGAECGFAHDTSNEQIKHALIKKLQVSDDLFPELKRTTNIFQQTRTDLSLSSLAATYYNTLLHTRSTQLNQTVTKRSKH